jgi:hypothetical protein
MGDQVETVWTLPSLPLAWVAAGVLVLLFALAIWILLRRKPTTGASRQLTPALDVASLTAAGPPAQGPRLEVYGTAVRLAAVVLAPAGREGRLPQPEAFPQLIDQIVPGMAEVAAAHQPRIDCWSSQLSSQGFVHAFFNNAVLPGDRGRDTPWCSIAGRFRAGGQNYLAGLVLRAAADNALGQFEIQHEGQWNDVLRVRAAAE